MTNWRKILSWQIQKEVLEESTAFGEEDEGKHVIYIISYFEDNQTLWGVYSGVVTKERDISGDISYITPDSTGIRDGLATAKEAIAIADRFAEVGGHRRSVSYDEYKYKKEITSSQKEAWQIQETIVTTLEELVNMLGPNQVWKSLGAIEVEEGLSHAYLHTSENFKYWHSGNGINQPDVSAGDAIWSPSPNTHSSFISDVGIWKNQEPYELISGDLNTLSWMQQDITIGTYVKLIADRTKLYEISIYLDSYPHNRYGTVIDYNNVQIKVMMEGSTIVWFIPKENWQDYIEIVTQGRPYPDTVKQSWQVQNEYTTEEMLQALKPRQVWSTSLLEPRSVGSHDYFHVGLHPRVEGIRNADSPDDIFVYDTKWSVSPYWKDPHGHTAIADITYGPWKIIEGPDKIHTSASNAITKPEGLKNKMQEVSLGEDDKGYYVYTHRARSDSYESPESIPDKDITFISSTGSLKQSWQIQGPDQTSISVMHIMSVAYSDYVIIHLGVVSGSTLQRIHDYLESNNYTVEAENFLKIAKLSKKIYGEAMNFYGEDSLRSPQVSGYISVHLVNSDKFSEEEINIVQTIADEWRPIRTVFHKLSTDDEGRRLKISSQGSIEVPSITECSRDILIRFIMSTSLLS